MHNHVVTTLLFDRQRLGKYADWLAIVVAVALPWSTTSTQVAVLLWLVTLGASWNIAERFRERWMLAGALPVVLWTLGAVGMLWASVPLAERLGGLNSFHKLLAIPFLAVQFRDSARGIWVLIGFLISCTLLLVLSWVLVLIPDLPWPGYHRVGERIMIGIPVKDYISQSTVFTLCILGLTEGAFFAWHKGSRRLALAFILLAIIFLANILYVAVSRTALVALPILLVLFCFRRLGWKSTVSVMIALTIFLAMAWSTSPYLRERVTDLVDDVRNYQPSAVRTPAGERLEYWRKSIIIIMNAPFFGHGTGSIREQFRQLAAGQTGMAGLTSANPHNQIFAIAIQLGLVGAAALLAMWIAHFLFFFAPGPTAGIGLAVVVQNIVSSLFNSSLFDYNIGWVYALGVGVLSGMTLRTLPAHSSGKRSTAEENVFQASW
jgi:O-antigen ligase